MTNTENYPGQTSFGLHTYVGDDRTEAGEAINVLPAVLGATLCGIDKRNQQGYNWALMCQEYFNNRPAENVYLNAPVTSSGSDWWYDVMPNVFFFQVYSAYPGTGDFNRQFTTVADRWLQAVFAMGGSLTPWSHPSLEHRGWYLATMTPNNDMPHEPEAGGSIAWLLYNASVVTGNDKYRFGAELCLEELNAYTTNPAYELQLAYGAGIAARMNAELGTTFDVEKMVNWCFNVSPIRSWGAVVGRWGGYDCSGLIGEINGVNDYPFAMNTFEQIGALVPLVRYDSRFANAIGKWVLNAANASRLFYGAYLTDAQQDSRAWSIQYDPASVIAHEALRQRGPGSVSPYATGDAIAGGWAATNLSLYSSSHVGILGAIIDTTEVQGLLRLDLLATDYFHGPAYPTYLYYNPDTVAHDVQLTLTGGTSDVYNVLSKSYLVQGASGSATLTIPSREAVVAVITPAGGVMSYDEERMLIDGVVVDYRSGHVPSNHRPRIKGIGAAPSPMYQDGTAQLYCTSVDVDGDSLTYLWSASLGTLAGSGAHVSWTAPHGEGTYDIRCMVMDAHGDSTAGNVRVTVVDSALSIPVISEMVAVPGKVDRGETTTVICRASRCVRRYSLVPLGRRSGIDNRERFFCAVDGTVVVGNWTLRCTVSNRQGGTVRDSIVVPVRDFAQGGTGDRILFIPCNGSVADASGYANQVTPTDITYVADRFGTASHACGFNGATSSLRVTNTPVLNCDSAITVNLWVKPGMLGTKELFLISHGSWQNRWKISLTPERKVRWTIKTTNGVKDIDSRTTLVTGTHYCVTGVYNGTDLDIYVNGILERFAPWSGTLLKPPIDLMVGQMLPGDANYNFPGVIDDISVYDYGMNPPQVHSLWQVVTGVFGPGDSKDPVVTALTGVFPNPFNPVTEIHFDIGTGDAAMHGGSTAGAGGYVQVDLRVYDILGREVATLVDGPLPAGHHTAWFDGRSMASGVYYCRLAAGAHTDVVRILLLR